MKDARKLSFTLSTAPLATPIGLFYEADTVTGEQQHSFHPARSGVTALRCSPFAGTHRSCNRSGPCGLRRSADRTAATATQRQRLPVADPHSQTHSPTPSHPHSRISQSCTAVMSLSHTSSESVDAMNAAHCFRQSLSPAVHTQSGPSPLLVLSLSNHPARFASTIRTRHSLQLYPLPFLACKSASLLLSPSSSLWMR